MLFDTHATQTAQASLDALWLKTQVITNNIANSDTPGFKSSSVSFAEVFDKASRNASASPEQRQQLLQQEQSLAAQQQANTSGIQGPVYRTTISTDTESSVRLDGNNVSLEAEQSELWKTYAQYSYLLDRISGHYNAINTAITNMKG